MPLLRLEPATPRARQLPSELQLNKANASDTEAAFLDLHLSISNDIVSTKIYDKRDDFDFEIVNFPFLDGDVPRSTSYGVYISQLIRFARASSYVADFNTRNKLLTQKLLKQGYRYHKLRKTFSKFYRRYYDLISKFQVGLKSRARQLPSELQLNKANASDTEAAFLDLHLSISNDIVSTKIYDKRDDFDFEIVNFPFLDGDVPRSTSYGVYISQLIRFARASSYVADFNTRNKLLTQKLLKQGYRYHKLRKTFSKFYRRYYDFISKFQVGLKSLLRQGLSEPDFYGDLVYKLKRIVGSNNFSAQFIKIISHYKKIGYNINVLQQTACLVVNPITVGNFAFLFNCTLVGRTSDSMMVPT